MVYRVVLSVFSLCLFVPLWGQDSTVSKNYFNHKLEIPVTKKFDFPNGIKDSLEFYTQVTKDDKILQKYFLDKAINPSKTIDGIYALFHNSGDGISLSKDAKRQIKYKLKRLDGIVIDSTNELMSLFIDKDQLIVFPGFEHIIKNSTNNLKATYYVSSVWAYYSDKVENLYPAFQNWIFELEVPSVIEIQTDNLYESVQTSINPNLPTSKPLQKPKKKIRKRC